MRTYVHMGTKRVTLPGQTTSVRAQGLPCLLLHKSCQRRERLGDMLAVASAREPSEEQRNSHRELSRRCRSWSAPRCVGPMMLATTRR
eukprot:3775830-Pleurochrysis_carterae.AAC.1